jgi:hypothetical protein
MKKATEIVMGLLVGTVVLLVAAASRKNKRIKKAFEVKPLTETEAQKALEESNQGELIGRRE